MEPKVVYKSLNPERLGAWLDHVTFAFSEKKQTPPRSYFSHHIDADPWRNYEGVHIAEIDGEIVSTVRVFHRSAYFHGSTLKMGGIGEVCTNKEHRKKGYAGKLLKQAVQYMKDNTFQISSLLAGVENYYQKFGWSPRPRYYGTTTLEELNMEEAEPPKKKRKTEEDMSEAHPLREIIAKKELKDDDLEKLNQIYPSYSKRFCGPFVRNIAYWKEWILKDVKFLKHGNIYLCISNGDIVAYVITYFVEKDNQMSVMEFGCSEREMKDDGGRTVFLDLVKHAAQSQKLEKIKFQLPIILQFHEQLRNYTEEIDRILYYQVINDNATELSNDFINKDENFYKENHVFWDMDKF